MKPILLLLISSLLLAEVHTFNKVNFNGTTLEMVRLELDSGYKLFYKGKLLDKKYVVRSCRAKEGFCIKEGNYDVKWIRK